MSSLADAILQENYSEVRAFLNYGMNLNQLDEYGFTPLIEAAIVDNLDIAKLLIEFGADVNFVDSLGGTPLYWAAENNNLDLTQLLLKQGANPNTVNLAGQPILVMPLLRKQQELKNLLISAGANLEFAQDFINTKFLGHLYELVGTANIISPDNEFVEVDFEGFFLETTLAMIAESLEQFRFHFAGRKLRQYNSLTGIIVDALYRAAQFIRYQQYRVDRTKHKLSIDALIHDEPIIIPVAYDGHAITFIKFKNILVKSDRREESRLYDNIVFYQIQNSQLFSKELIKKMVFEKQSFESINEEFPQLLDLKPLTELKIDAQISGNCSWANVEACIPALFFLLFSNASNFLEKMGAYKKLALDFFHEWREWSKDRALNFCIQSMNQSDSIRKGCKGEILAAILFQTYADSSPRNKARVETILEVFREPSMQYLLQNYVKSYCFEDTGEEGRQFLRFLKANELSG